MGIITKYKVKAKNIRRLKSYIQLKQKKETEIKKLKECQTQY
tara:strand:+ start:530 stop:655 length:126 start_codon:yes stop_codon:yes gene_type:complete